MENLQNITFNEHMLLDELIMNKMVEYRQLSENRKNDIIPLGCSVTIDREKRDNDILKNDIIYNSYVSHYEKYSKIYSKINSLVTM